MRNLIQVDHAVLSELDSWLNDHNGPKLSAEAATALIRDAFSEYLKSVPDDFVDRHEVHRFDVSRHDGGPSSPSDFDLGAVRVPSTSGSRRWLVGSLSTTRPTKAYEVERQTVVSECRRSTTAADEAESAVVDRDAVAIPRLVSDFPMPDLAPTQSQKQPDDSLTEQVRTARPPPRVDPDDTTITFRRCVVAGIWANIIGAVGLASADGIGGVVVFVVLAGLPWLMFSINDHNEAGKRLDVFIACGTLVGGALLSGLCALPFMLLLVLVKWMAG